MPRYFVLIECPAPQDLAKPDVNKAFTDFIRLCIRYKRWGEMNIADCAIITDSKTEDLIPPLEKYLYVNFDDTRNFHTISDFPFIDTENVPRHEGANTTPYQDVFDIAYTAMGVRHKNDVIITILHTPQAINAARRKKTGATDIIECKSHSANIWAGMDMELRKAVSQKGRTVTWHAISRRLPNKLIP